MSLRLGDIRRGGSLIRRFLQDALSGRSSRFARAGSVSLSDVLFPIRLSVDQPITPSAHADAKRHNIARAAGVIDRIVLQPGEIFSFWKLVGSPSAGRDFLPGRSLLGGRLVLDYGGGLCQLSGALYYLALQGGLPVLERYPHTLDLYTEEDRYAPLGADAAVAYGFKDLRFRNPYPFPVALRIDLHEWELVAHLCASQPIESYAIEFDRIESSRSGRHVSTYRSRNGMERELLDASSYIVHSSVQPTNHEPV